MVFFFFVGGNGGPSVWVSLGIMLLAQIIPFIQLPGPSLMGRVLLFMFLGFLAETYISSRSSGVSFRAMLGQNLHFFKDLGWRFLRASGLYPPPWHPDFMNDDEPQDGGGGGGGNFGGGDGNGGIGAAERSARLERVTQVIRAMPIEEFEAEEALRSRPVGAIKSELRRRGVDPTKVVCLEKDELIAKLREARGGGSSASSCSICFDDYVPGAVLRRLPCNHRFHLECIDKWAVSAIDFSRAVACPICNKPISAS